MWGDVEFQAESINVRRSGDRYQLSAGENPHYTLFVVETSAEDGDKNAH
ncbi:hypothetical protein [Rhodophyticola sp. CCM32]|nr:hypothetical protein [Rhodophyticola sp. CCM32]